MLSAFIIVVGVLVYAWIIYPVVVLLSSRLSRFTSHISRFTPPAPPVFILFSAHNEEAVILKRLENLAALDYPADRLRILVGVDGGNDRTAEIALEWAASHPNVHVFVSPANHGKSAMLKRLVGEAREQRAEGGGQRAESSDSGASLLAFTDANTFFKSDALRHLVAPFVDPKVGGVCGRLVFLPPKGAGQLSSCQVAELSGDRPKGSLCSSSTTGQPGNLTTSSPAESGRETVYWDLETRLKAAESRLDSCLGANGAIYAIRAELFPARFPDNTIIDDFVIGMKVREQGYRFVYEATAVANEELPVTVKDEWRRRVRIGAGAYQALALCWRCLLPRYGVFAWMFASHKVLRWFTPHFGIVLLVIGYWLWLNTPSPFRGEGWGEGVLLLISGVIMGGVLLVLRFGCKVFKLAAYFLTMQAALFAGFLRFCRGGLKGSWARTERGNPSP